MKIALSMRSWLIGVALMTLIFDTASAQYTQIGDVTFANSIFGPMVGRTDSNRAYSRHAYIYPQASLGILEHGDTIRMLQFYKYGTGRFTGSPRFVIHMGMSDTADFGNGNIPSWSTESKINGTTKVYDNTVGSIVDSVEGYKSFWFDTPFRFDTTKGKHLKIMVEFYQFTKQNSGQIPVWGYENNNSVAAFVSNNETKYVFSSGTAPDTTNASNVRKPTLRIFHPRHKTSASVDRIYCLGELALLMNPVDTIKARVFATGSEIIRNHPFELVISGANSFRDTIYIDSLKPFENRMIHFTSYKPKRRGIDSIRINSLNDGFTQDDTLRQRRRISDNVLSHNNPFVDNSVLGIGFSGGTGDFVAKFYTDSSYINQVKIGFSTLNLPFKLVIWDANSQGLPGNILYESDTLFTNGGQYIQPVLPRVRVKDAYFVGIRQTSTNNVGFVFEPEVPVRSGAFFFAGPIGDTNWVPFSPGFDYNFDIQPRIQVDHDISVLRISNPVDQDTLEFSLRDSFAPKATIFNFGAKDENIPFDVVCRVTNQFNSVVYESKKLITLDANDSTIVTFDTTLALSNYGPLKMEVFPLLPGEQARENDTATAQFYIFVNYDIQVESFFTPTNGQQIELNMEKIPPTVRVFNFGVKDQKGVAITSRLVQGSKVAQQQTIFTDLTGQGSEIITFDSITIPFLGKVTFEVFCWNAIDSFPINDTARVTVNVVRSNDLGVVSVVRPADSSVYLRNDKFKPYIEYRNFGLASQDSVRVTGVITQEDGTVIYSHTLYADVDLLSSLQALFKEFTAPDSAQTLYFDAETFIKNDQDTTNDKLRTKFFIRTPKDLKLEKIIHPSSDSLHLVGDPIDPSMVIRNIGNIPVSGTQKFRVLIYDPAQTLVHEDSIMQSVNLLYNDPDSVEYAKQFVPKTNGTYTIVMYTIGNNDGEKSNDTISSTFDVSYRYSFEMNTILQPESKNYQLNKDTIKPAIIIKNIGVKDAASTIYYTLKGNDGSNDVYVYNDSVTSLEAGESELLNASKYFLPPSTGSYTLTATLTNSDDQVLSDNELSVGFNVSLAHDVRPKAFVLPEVDSLVYANRTYAPQAKFENIGDSNQTSAFSVSMLIEFNSSVIYSSNRSILLNTGDSQVVKFDQNFKPTIPGTYSMMAITRLGTDQVTSNDTLRGEFTVDWNSSVNEALAKNIAVYPNPTNGIVTIEIDDLEGKKLMLYDNVGREVGFNTIEHRPNHWVIEIEKPESVSSVLFLGIETENYVVWKRLLKL